MSKRAGIVVVIGGMLAAIGACSTTPPADNDRGAGGSSSSGTSATGAVGPTAGTSTTGGATGAGTAGTAGTAAGQTGTMCMAPQTDCGGVCTNTQTSVSNCGGCGVACTGNQTCVAGMCGCDAAAGLTDCSGMCVNTQTDSANCGMCGMACGGNQSCVGGMCTCPAGTMLCGTECVDLTSDVNNCGACNMACVSPQVCDNSACSDTCSQGRENCNGSCVDLQTSPTDCGMCGNACGGDSTCTAGACSCADATQTSCNGVCTDTQTDNANCGMCGTMCSGGRTCQAGLCDCPDGQIFCTDTCVDQATAPADCVMNQRDCPIPQDMISDFEEGPVDGVLPAVLAQNGWSGEWEDFNDGTGTQTLTIESVGSEQCNQWALHTTGSNFSDWGAGVGFALAGTGPMPVVVDVGNWSGIRFRARSGSAQMTPVRFNISTPWTEQTDSGGDCVSSDVYECYNHAGAFLYQENELTTDWKDYTFCFDSDLYPLFLPSNLTAEQRRQIPQNLLKVQFQFNKAKDPATQNGTEEWAEYQKNLPFDFWVDDIQLVTGDCAASIPFQSSGGTAQPFPQNKVYNSCALPENVEIYNAAVAYAYLRWKEKFLVSDGGGQRVNSPEQGNITVSEGQGYGMLLTAAMGDKAAFDALWSYTQSRISGGLMGWTPGDNTSASDADEDIAYGLAMADKQWGGYASAASSMASAIYDQDVKGGHLAPGNSSHWDGNIVNPSYFSPAFYSVFQSVSGQSGWGSVISADYGILNACNSSFGGANNGLLPDWCRADGSPITAGEAGADVTNEDCGGTICYGYDAARTPWRIGMDACATGRSDATSYLNNLVGFFADRYASTGINLLKTAWDANGNVLDGKDNQMSYIGPVGVGAMATSRKDTFEGLFRATLDIINNPEYNGTYYPTTIGMISLLIMTGNFPFVQ